MFFHRHKFFFKEPEIRSMLMTPLRKIARERKDGKKYFQKVVRHVLRVAYRKAKNKDGLKDGSYYTHSKKFLKEYL